MEFKVLGPLEVSRDRRPLEITAPKQRTVLASLLVSANQVVSFDRLIDHLWGNEAPPRATATLQVYISSLRRAFEPDRTPRSPGRVLLSKPPGYVLAVDPARFDATLLAEGVSAARGHLVAGDPAAARRRLGAAMALWRGPAYADFAHEPFAQAEAARLEMLRVVAIELGAEADLAVGLHQAAASELEIMVARYPFRESLWASYLLALYRSGRQADALRAYQSCRTTLTEELGIGPGPALRRLEAAILAQEPSLDWRPLRSPGPGASVTTEGGPAGGRPPGPGHALVGRSTELHRLDAAWRGVATGRGTCVLVSGEAGIGKTRLVEELAGRAAAAGADVAWGRCQERADAPAFWPWAQVVRSLLALHSQETMAGALRRSGLSPADLAPLGLPAPGGVGAEPPPLVDPGAARFRLGQAVTTVVTALAAQRPILIVLDDLHWADPASLQLLGSLASEVPAACVLLVGTYRDREVSDDHPLVEALASISRSPTVERVALAGLSQAEVADFVTAATGDRANPSVVENVYRRTNGNPFFVGEVVRLLASERALDDPAVAAGAEVPASVRDVIRRRLAQLPERTSILLAVAATAGQEFDLTVVEAVGGLGGDDVLDALEPARLSGVIVESPGSVRLCHFSHALVHETILAGMSPLRRARTHARIADALEAGSTPPRAVELGHHLWAASPVVAAERVLAALLAAAEEALGGLAYEQAGEHLQRAIEALATLPPGEDRDRQELWAQVRLGMVVANTKGNSSPRAVASFARARELCARVPQPPEQLATLYGLFLVSWVTLDLAAGDRYASQLLEVAATTRDPSFFVAGHQARGLIAFQRGGLASTRHHLDQAVLGADSLSDPWLAEVLQGDPSITGRCFGAFVAALYGRGPEAGALAEAGLERARRSQHPWTIAVALAMRSWVAVVLHDDEQAEPYANEAATYSRENGFELLAAATCSMKGWAAARAGDLAAGIELGRAGFRDSQATGMRLMLTFQHALMAEIELRAGLTDDALATADRGLAEVEETGERFYEAELYRLRGEVLVASGAGREPEAERCFVRAVDVARSQGAVLLEQRAVDSRERLRAGLSSAR